LEKTNIEYRLIMIRFLFIFCFLNCSYLQSQIWTLEDCIDYANKNNIDIKKNSIEQKIKLKDIDINKRERLPNLYATNSSVFSFGQQQDIFGDNRRNDNLNFSTSVSSEFTLYNNSIINKNIKKAKYEAESSFYKGEDYKQQLSIKVVENYLSILLNKEIEKVNYNNMLYTQEILEKVEKSNKVGVSSKKELKEAEAEYIKEDFNYIKSGLETKKLIQQLAQTLQIDNYQNFDIVPIDKDIIDIHLIDFTDILNRIIENNPAIKQSKVNIDIEKLNKSIIKTNHYPKLSLASSVGSFYFNSFVYRSNNSFFKQNIDNFTQQLNFSLTIPIYNRGIIKIQIAQSDLQQQYAQESHRLQILNIEQQLKNIFLDIDLFYETYLASIKLVESSQAAYDYGVKSFDAGVSTIYDLNILRNNLRQAESEVIKAKYSYIFNLEMLNVYLKKK